MGPNWALCVLKTGPQLGCPSGTQQNLATSYTWVLTGQAHLGCSSAVHGPHISIKSLVGKPTWVVGGLYMGPIWTLLEWLSLSVHRLWAMPQQHYHKNLFSSGYLSIHPCKIWTSHDSMMLLISHCTDIFFQTHLEVWKNWRRTKLNVGWRCQEICLLFLCGACSHEISWDLGSSPCGSQM